MAPARPTATGSATVPQMHFGDPWVPHQHGGWADEPDARMTTLNHPGARAAVWTIETPPVFGRWRNSSVDEATAAHATTPGTAVRHAGREARVEGPGDVIRR